MSDSTATFELLSAWADALTETARAAGRVILDIYAQDFEVFAKADQSPVTVADGAAEALILKDLAKLHPAFPIVAEEHVAAHGFPEFEGNTFWLVDALDGTKEFIKRNGDFTVNIGLIHDGVPVLGIIATPVRDEIHVGIALGKQHSAKVWRNGVWTPIRCRARAEKVVVVGSKSHQIKDRMDAYLSDWDVADVIAVSSSLKFCMIAEGKADLYPRFGPTSEWDTAAGHAIVRGAGGWVRTFDGPEMPYKKPRFLNGEFLAESLIAGK